jgi:hypothetical protein
MEPAYPITVSMAMTWVPTCRKIASVPKIKWGN